MLAIGIGVGVGKVHNASGVILPSGYFKEEDTPNYFIEEGTEFILTIEDL